jgi:hypothetical protein
MAWESHNNNPMVDTGIVDLVDACDLDPCCKKACLLALHEFLWESSEIGVHSIFFFRSTVDPSKHGFERCQLFCRRTLTSPFHRGRWTTKLFFSFSIAAFQRVCVMEMEEHESAPKEKRKTAIKETNETTPLLESSSSVG